MSNDNKFTIPQESISGAPAIHFKFDGSLATAELAGAKLTASRAGDDRASLQIVDAEGEVIADVIVRKMPRDENITVSVMNVGTALLWSHARWAEVQAVDRASPVPPPSAPNPPVPPPPAAYVFGADPFGPPVRIDSLRYPWSPTKKDDDKR
jgi:hypothetical protein